ncbi:alpha/beta fold hydrolase [Conexibacter stalactiti]|uniref:Alpha/beta fold hydrolase n=1 Tax=Conexibacter stalactiti TaxID=1940611 RepID=A0ABU4HU65_9ACTN|nr:alpha/beta fold hydrolase [Conexibacter stalactiti]MDW5596860.1 alpha/beta fold hydrolase [Conexibacter stalactiti]MEC5037502.1 alpha/beta fold hydrolase [Conexibacter stalactiti]
MRRNGSNGRWRATLRAVAALTVVAAPAAVVPDAAEAAPLAFAPCAEKAQAGWECATLSVPLDHSGATPGTLELRVQRLAHDGPPRGKALVNIEGGPGGSTTARSAQTRRLLGAVTAKHGYDLILLDTRATGASRPQEIALGTSRFYSTADTVRDLELMRQGLGIEKLALMGTSYSTLYVTEFARTFPQRTDRVIADSPLGPAGPDHFGAVTAAAALPVLRDICRRSACPGGPGAAVRDLETVIARAKRGLFWIPEAMVWRGRRMRDVRMGVQWGTLLTLMVGADEATARFAQLPIRLRDAARGEWRTLGRDVGGARESSTPINPDVTRITRCLDARVPWPFEAPFEQRSAPVKALEAQVPLASLKPWNPKLIGNGPLWGCVEFGPSGLPGAIKGGAVPAVPGLILQGAWDLRTPAADARALAAAWPSATLVLAPGTGHGVLRAATTCATVAVDALLAGQQADGDACAELEPVAAPLLVGAEPEDLRALPGAPRAVAKTAHAVVATIHDAEVAVAAAAPRGGVTQPPGIADGFARATRRAGAPTVIRLSGYALQDGLLLDGTVTVRSTTAYAAQLKLSGRHSGSVKIAGGRMSGTIDGRKLDLRLRGALARPAVTRFG